MTDQQQWERLYGIFFPDQAEQFEELGANQNRRFVHYTTAEAALSILSERKVWMRSPATMNDYREIRHGYDCLMRLAQTPLWDRFYQAIGATNADVGKSVMPSIATWATDLLFDSYITCLSQHLPEEDDDGRLSMWRAYGSKASVALVLRPAVFLSDSSSLEVYSSPVSYFTDADTQRRFERVTSGLEREAEFIRSCSRQWLAEMSSQLIANAILCTKHPSFREELEWRIWHVPWKESSPHVQSQLKSVGGVAQKVYLLPLQSMPDQGFHGADPEELIERILIGPSPFAEVMRRAFVDALKSAGVSSPDTKVFVSGTSLRV